MDRRVWTLACSLGVVTLLALAVWVTPTHSGGMATVNAQLNVESCLVQGSSTFRLRAVNRAVAGEWRLLRHNGEEIINFGYLDAYGEVGSFGADATITTTVEGTWKKQFLEGSSWVNRNGAHALSVDGHTEAGLLCPPDPAYELGNLVWYDTDQDGIQDPGEPGVEGIGVGLYDDPTCSGSLTYTDTTDSSGTYLFADILSGTLCLEFSNIPAGWEISLQNQGGDDTIDSDAAPINSRIENINLAADDYSQDAGLYVDGSIGDRVWCDFDGNHAYDPGEGMANITVWLHDDPNCDGQEDALLATLETIGDGQYYFTELNSGPPGSTTEFCDVVIVDAYDEDLGACNLPLTDLGFGFLLNADAPSANTGDFGFNEKPGRPHDYWSFCPLVISEHQP